VPCPCVRASACLRVRPSLSSRVPSRVPRSPRTVVKDHLREKRKETAPCTRRPTRRCSTTSLVQSSSHSPGAFGSPHRNRTASSSCSGDASPPSTACTALRADVRRNVCDELAQRPCHVRAFTHNGLAAQDHVLPGLPTSGIVAQSTRRVAEEVPVRVSCCLVSWARARMNEGIAGYGMEYMYPFCLPCLSRCVGLVVTRVGGCVSCRG
jgi:hypothetical protein